jgi:hypothetical protein
MLELQTLVISLFAVFSNQPRASELAADQLEITGITGIKTSNKLN